jgi:hypothetical protein
VLDGKVKFTHDVRRLDRTAAVLNSCAAYLTSPSADKKKERAAVLWQIMAGLLDDEVADLCVGPARVLSRAKLGIGVIKEATKSLAKLGPVLAAAEIE